MSLSSLLLRSAESTPNSVDKGLDAIFKSTAPLPAPSESWKRKREQKEETLKKSKKPKVDTDAVIQDALVSGGLDREVSMVEGTVRSEQGKRRKKSRKKSVEKGRKKAMVESDETCEVESTSRTSSTQAERSGHSRNEDSQSLVHESLLRNIDRPQERARSTHPKKIKFAPPNETAEQRSGRTVFIGNVPAEVGKSKPLLKQFKRHILSYIPSAQVESVRFRSIAFQKPTTKLEDEGGKKSKSEPKGKDKQPRQHDVQRVSSWQDSRDSEAGTVAAEKKYLTPQEKKRVAFITHDFHEGADIMTAYMVFAHPQPIEGRAANVPAPPPVMDPYEAARLAVEKANDSVFHQKTIRIDFVHDKSKSVGSGTGIDGDSRLSVFVGNLDFGSKEEDLRAFFESLISTKRGAPPQVGQSDEDAEGGDGTKLSKWVTRVRIIRDRDTQLGKGFAYIQFADRECVDEALALEQDEIKFAKRKLRVQRCKSLPSGSGRDSMAQSTSTHAPPKKNSTPITILSVPKGDPSLGKKLEHLSKEERKQRKASDTDRVARRLAKKKVKIAMGKAGVKAQVRDRERTRRRADPRKVAAAPKTKGRVRK